MKLVIVNVEGTGRAVFEHTDKNFLVMDKDAEGIFVDSPLVDIKSNLPVANTCVAWRNILLNPKLKAAFVEHIGLVQGPYVSSIYGMFNGTKFSELLEVCYSGKFMTGDAGIDVGFAKGAALRVSNAPSDLLPAFNGIVQALHDINYRGEVLFHISESYEVTNLFLGHFYGHFGLFSEAAQGTVQAILDFVFGKVDTCILYDSLNLGVLVSKFPYPFRKLAVSTQILSPKGAEKHLWRFKYEAQEAALITVHGSSLQEAKRRMQRTIDNLKYYDQDLQYRSDFGYREYFLAEQETYQRLSSVVHQTLSLVDKNTSDQCMNVQSVQTPEESLSPVVEPGHP